MTTATNDVGVLNTLVATLLASVDGYQKSAGDIDNIAFADKFIARVRKQQPAVTKLQAAAATAGGDPEYDGTLLDGARRAFQSLKEAVMSHNDKSFVVEIERGADYLKGKFETVLADGGLSPVARKALEKAWQSVRAGHDEMCASSSLWVSKC